MKKQTAITTVQPASEVAHAQMLQNLGASIIRKVGEVTQLYLELVLYIRNNKVAPKLVTFELTHMGFEKSRVSEINRVANASDKLFSMYQAKFIGFNKTLMLARHESKDGPIESTQAAKILLEGKAVSKEEIEAAMKDEENETGNKPRKSDVAKMEQAAQNILRLAKKAKVWTSEKWTLTLTKGNAQ